MDALEAITGRHGVLRFRPDPVEPAKIEAVLAAAVAAPSPVNLQPWAFVVVAERINDLTPVTARRQRSISSCGGRFGAGNSPHRGTTC